MAWTAGSAATQAALQLAALGLLARLLEPADFGVVAALLVAVNFLGILTQLGLNEALVQRRDIDSGVVAAAFWTSLGLATAVVAVVTATAPLLAELLNVPEAAPHLRVLALTLMVRALGATSEALLVRELAFRKIAVVEVVSYGVGFGVFGVVLAVLGAGVWALVVAHVGRAALKAAYTLALRPHSLRLATTSVPLAALFRYGGGLSLARVANQLALQLDNLVVARTFGPRELGLYSRAYQLMGVPGGLMGTAIDRTLFPILSRSQDDRRSLARAFETIMSAIGLACVPLGVLLAVTADEVVALVLGAQWEEAVPLFQVLAATLVFRLGDRLNAVVARAVGAVYRRAALQVVYACAVPSFAYVGTRYGLEGVAWGVALALALNYVLSTWLSVRLLGVSVRRLLAGGLRLLPATALTTLIAIGAVTALRFAGAHPALRFAATGFLALVATGVAAWRWPRTFLGDQVVRLAVSLGSTASGQMAHFAPHGANRA